MKKRILLVCFLLIIGTLSPILWGKEKSAVFRLEADKIDVEAMKQDGIGKLDLQIICDNYDVASDQMEQMIKIEGAYFNVDQANKLCMEGIYFLDEKGSEKKNSTYQLSAIDLVSKENNGNISMLAFDETKISKGYHCLEIRGLEIVRIPGQYGQISLWLNGDYQKRVIIPQEMVDSEIAKAARALDERSKQVEQEAREQAEKEALQKELNAIKNGLQDLSKVIEVDVKGALFGSDQYKLVIKEKKAGALKEGVVLKLLPEHNENIRAKGIWSFVETGDIKLEKGIEDTVKVVKASKTPSVIEINYLKDPNNTLPYKNYDLILSLSYEKKKALYPISSMKVKDAMINTPVSRASITEDKELFFRSDSEWYLLGTQKEAYLWPQLMPKKMSGSTYTKNGQLMVPLREMVGVLDESKLAAKGDQLTIDFTLQGEKQQAYVNDEKRQLKSAPELKEGITFVSLEALAELFHFTCIKDDQFGGTRIIIPREKNDEQTLKLYLAEDRTFKVGLQQQMMSDIHIIEDKANTIKEGKIVISLDELEKQKGITLTNAPKITLKKGDIEIGKAVIDPKVPHQVIIPVLKASTAPSELVLSGLELTVTRTAPEGEYKMHFGGDAVGEEVKTIKLVIKTSNTCD